MIEYKMSPQWYFSIGCKDTKQLLIDNDIDLSNFIEVQESYLQIRAFIYDILNKRIATNEELDGVDVMNNPQYVTRVFEYGNIYSDRFKSLLMSERKILYKRFALFNDLYDHNICFFIENLTFCNDTPIEF